MSKKSFTISSPVCAADFEDLRTFVSEGGALSKEISGSWIFRGKAVVARDRQKVIGAAARRRTALHPRSEWVSVYVDPAHRGAGVGSALLRELITQSRRSLKARVPVDASAALRFASAHGFEPLILSAETFFSSPLAVDSMVSVETVDDASDDIADAFAQLYRISHAWDVPSRLPRSRARALFLGEDLLPGTIRCVRRRDGALAGVAAAHRPERTDRYAEIAYCGALDVDSSEAEDISLAMLVDLVTALVGKGPVAVECDRGPGSNLGLAQALDRIGARQVNEVAVVMLRR